MVEKEERAPRAAAAAARPTITLPPRSAYESLFRGGGGFGAPEVSPGPMTLVSSFFTEDDGECRSFSQLLAGAMASPAARLRPGGEAQASALSSSGNPEKESGEGGARPHRPLGLVVPPSPFLTVPSGLSPACLLESPSLFSPGPYMTHGPYGISHQQALAHVTAQAIQAAHTNAQQMHMQVASHSDVSAAVTSLTQPASPDVSSAPLEQTQTVSSENKVTVLERAECSDSKQRSQLVSVVLDKPADDGYNWRKYGQKQVKGSECPRSYYKCTHPNCPVKKKVERSPEGLVTEIIYKGQHNHQPPPPNKRTKEGSLPGGCGEMNGTFDVPVNSEMDSRSKVGKSNRSIEHTVVAQTSDRHEGHVKAKAEELSGLSDGEDVRDAEVKTGEANEPENDPKRRKTDARVVESSGGSQRTLTEPRIIVQTKSEVDLLDDGYRWRKYGQKVVKGNPYPRSYYKCTSSGCNVRKHVERAASDRTAVITTYEGKHNHDIPASRSSGQGAANSASASQVIHPKLQNVTNDPKLPGRTEFRSDIQPHVAVLQLKEEHEVA